MIGKIMTDKGRTGIKATGLPPGFDRRKKKIGDFYFVRSHLLFEYRD